MAKEIELPDGSIGEFPDTMSDAEILGVLRKQFGGGPQRPAADTRSTGTRLYQDYIAKPLTSAVGGAMETVTTPFVPLARMAQGESVRAAFGPESFTTQGVGGAAEQARNKAAAVVVPQTPLQAGITAGTLAAGPVARAVPALAPLATAHPALARIFGGTVGGAVGGGVEDPTLTGIGTGAAWGAGTTAAGELVGKVLGKAARSAPGAKGAIAAQDAAAYGTEIGRQSPPLAGAQTVQDLQRLAQGEGRTALGAAKERAVQEIEAAIGQRPLLIPSLSERPMSLRDANAALSEIGSRAFSRNPLDRTFQGVDQRRLYGQIEQEIRAALDALQRSELATGADISRRAAESLRHPPLALPAASGATTPGPPRVFAQGPMAESANPTTWRTLAEQRRMPSPPGLVPMRPGPQDTLSEAAALLRGEPKPYVPMGVPPARPNVVIETTANTAREIPPVGGPGLGRMAHAPIAEPTVTRIPTPDRLASEMFDTAQADYKKGLALLRPLQVQNAYRLSPSDVQFNTPVLQQFVQNPRNVAILRNKLGDEGYTALLNVLTRGAGAGKDVLAPGRGGMLDAAMQVFGRGTNSGAAGYLGVPLRTLAPNIGSQYVGRPPLQLPPALQQVLDLALQQAIDLLLQRQGPQAVTRLAGQSPPEAAYR